MDDEDDIYALCDICGLEVDPGCDCQANKPVNVGDELHQVLGEALRNERERNSNCERRLKKLERLGFKDAADFARNPNED